MTFSLELPGIFLDGLVTETPSSVLVFLNRDPEPDESNVPIGTAISIDIADLGASPILGSSVLVQINGVTAYNGGAGGFQAGYTVGSSTSNPDANTLRLIIQPATPFGSLQIVSVHAEASTVAGDVLRQTWQFLTQDLTPPALVKGLAWGIKTFRVTASEPLSNTNATDDDSALNPANWAIQALRFPAVTVHVVSVAKVTDSIYDLTTDLEPSFSSTYRITATGTTDLWDNAFTAPTNFVDVAGYKCLNAPIDRDFNFYRFFPLLNRQEDQGDLQTLSAIIQDVIDLLLCKIDDFVTISDIDKAPEVYVDFILADLGNPFSFDLDINKKRRLAKILVSIYLLKGTSVGIVDAIAFFLGIEVTISALTDEGWVLGDSDIGVDDDLFPDGRAALYSFLVTVDQVLTPDQRTGIHQIVDYMKPVHTHFARLVEPSSPTAIDHIELGVSDLGIEWTLH